MDDARFNPTQSSSAGGDTGFDYFGAPPTAVAPGPSPFGAPPAQTQFGGPAQSQFAGPIAYGTPLAAQPVPRKSRSGRGSKALLIIVAIAVALGGFRLWNMHQQSRPITMPTTFNGLVPNPSPAAQEFKTTLLQEMRSRNAGMGINAEIYGDDKDFSVLGAARGHLDVQKDLTSANTTAPVTTGDTMCVTSLDKTFVACERSGLALTVFVLVRGGTPDVTATLVDSEYGQF
jgi:hypothetical protein